MLLYCFLLLVFFYLLIRFGVPGSMKKPPTENGKDLTMLSSVAEPEEGEEVVITSLPAQPELMAMIFSSLDLRSQLPLRSVCKKWENLVQYTWLNKKTVCISMNLVNERWRTCGYNIDYTVRDMAHLQQLIDRHANVEHLTIIGWRGHVSPMDTEPLTKAIATLRRVKHLQLHHFHLPPSTIRMLGTLHHLAEVNFQNCQLTGENLSCLGDNIRKLTFRHCFDLDEELILEALRSFRDRNIPLERLCVYDCCNALSLFHFVLENFASLRELKICPIDDVIIIPHQVLKRMAATNIVALELWEVNWPSFDYYHQMMTQLLAHPLPNLKALIYTGNNIDLEEDVLKLFRENCPKLESVWINVHACEDLDCQVWLANTHYDNELFSEDSEDF